MARVARATAATVAALLLLCGGLLTPACAAEIAQLSPASQDVAVLRVLLRRLPTPVGERLRVALAGRLAALGYTVTDDANGSAELTATLEVSVVAKPGVFAIYVNGVQKVSHEATATLVLRADDGTTLATATAQYDPDDPPSAEVVDTLAAAIAKPELSDILGQRGGRLVGERKQRAADERSRKARQQQADERSWNATEPDACRTPTSVGACDGVKLYVNAYPKGAHATEAQELLGTYEQKRPEIEDDEAWKSASVLGCAEAKQEQDCAGVRLYLQNRPKGKHAEEARAALDKGESSAKSASDDAAWSSANAVGCVAAATDNACEGVEKYLGDLPAGLHLKEANAALAQGNKKLEAKKRQRGAQQRAAACEAKCRGECSSSGGSEACMQGCRNTNACK